MTGRDAEREQLAAAVAVAMDAAYDFSSYRWPQQQDCPRIADLLLPVVDRIADQRAAAELRAAADTIDGDGQGGFTAALRRISATESLRARADALDPS